MSKDDDNYFDFDDELVDYCFFCRIRKNCIWYPNNLSNAQCESADEVHEKIKLGID